MPEQEKAKYIIHQLARSQQLPLSDINLNTVKKADGSVVYEMITPTEVTHSTCDENEYDINDDNIINSNGVNTLASEYSPFFCFLPGCTFLCELIASFLIVIAGDGSSHFIRLYVEE